MTRAAHRAASALLAVALLVAGVAPGPGSRPACVSCAPGCPMHARKIGCHHAREAGCHRGTPPLGVRSVCRHPDAADAPATSALRAVMPARSVAEPVAGARDARAPVRVLASQHVVEPPTDPPRAPVLPS